MPDIFVNTKKQKKPASSTLDFSNRAYMFSSFSKNPTNLSFKDQEPDEKIILFLRRHFITNISWILLGILLLLLPPLLIFINSKFNLFETQTFSPQFIPIVLIFYYLAVSTYIFINFLTWYYNVFIVTNKRVVDIDFADLVYKHVSSTSLNLVEDVSYTQAGVLPTLFDLGYIIVQTAGELENFESREVPHPQIVVEIIGNLIGKGKR